MRHSDAIDKIVSALLAAESEMGEVYKGGENKHNNYTYAQVEDIIAASKAILLKNGIVVVASPHDPKDVPTFKNNGHRILISMKVMFAHSSGQYIEIDSAGEGYDTQDKATYKAITGARKYALTSGLNLATTDDPDADNKDDDRDKRGAEANQRLGLQSQDGGGEDEDSLEAGPVRKRAMAICKEKDIAPAKVASWLKSKGFANMEAADEKTRFELLKTLREGTI